MDPSLPGSVTEHRKDGKVSRMRQHRGNMPSLPQSKQCPLCPAKFTRTTHLNRHMRTHSSERQHRCDACDAQFTRSDLLTRHKRSCGESSTNRRTRRKSCQSCADSKVKCDQEHPCSRCKARNRNCVYLGGSQDLEKTSEATVPSLVPQPEEDLDEESKEFILEGVRADPEILATKSSAFVVDYLTTTFPALSIEDNVAESPGAGDHVLDTDFDISGKTLKAYPRVHTSASLINNGSAASTSANTLDSTTQARPSLVSRTVYSSASSSSSASTPERVDNLSANHDFTTLFSSELGVLASRSPTPIYNSADFPEFFNDLFSSPSHPPSQAQVNANPFATEDFMVFDTPAGCGSPLQGDPFLSQLASVPVGDDVQSFLASNIGKDLYATVSDLSQFSQCCVSPCVAPAQPATLGIGGISQSQAMPLSPTAGDDPPAYEELQHYAYLFFTTFVKHIPCIHPPTWKAEGKPQVLILAMQACGALYVKTRRATSFILKVLEWSRDAVYRELMNSNPTNYDEQVYLILAVALLQTIALFHQTAMQRHVAMYHHNLMIDMIRRARFAYNNANWVPVDPDAAPSLDEAWRNWAAHEMAKRALMLLYLHDTCNAVYFARRSEIDPFEFDLNLPCEDALWNAMSAEEWYMTLKMPDRYGSTERARLVGPKAYAAFTAVGQPRSAILELSLSPFCHFIIVHSILRDIYICGMADRKDGAGKRARPDELVHMQRSLHNWLQSWLNSPETPRPKPGEEPPFMSYALPFYWLAQISILAYEEGLPPFQGGASLTDVEVRFSLIKRWVRQIRDFLRKGEENTTELLDGLMRIRLETRFTDVEIATGMPTVDDHDGLLGFFADEAGSAM